MTAIVKVTLALVLLWGLPVQPLAATPQEIIIFAARHYQLTGASHFQMWQARPDGTSKRPLRWPAGVPLFAFPSPDGQQYAYAGVWMGALPVYFQEERARDFLNGADPQDPALWIVHADGSARRRLLDRAPVDLRWLSSGRKLLLTPPPSLLDVHTGQRELLQEQPGVPTYHLSSVPRKFSTSELLFRFATEYVLAEKEGRYWRVHLPTRTIVPLPSLPAASPEEPALRSIDLLLLSSDGRTLAYLFGWFDWTTRADGDALGLMDLQEGTLKTFFKEGKEGEPTMINHVEWSPQGSQLLVERYQGLSGGPHSDLLIVNLETEQYHLIDSIASNTAQWAPSGRWVVYQTAPETRPLGKKQVWSTDIGVVKADGTDKTYLTSGAVYACLPRWITMTESQ